MKTKILSAFLALLMIAALAGCSSKPERGEISGDDKSAETADYSTPERSGNTYSSKFLGAKITLDENWTFSTDEEIAAMNNLTADLMGDEFSEQLKKADVIYDMMVADSATGDNININFENMGLVLGKVVSPKAYLELSQETYESAMAQIGAENVKSSLGKVDFAGEKEDALIGKIEASGVSMYQVVIAKSCGNYMASITITTMLEDRTADLIAKFEPVD